MYKLFTGQIICNKNSNCCYPEHCICGVFLANLGIQIKLPVTAPKCTTVLIRMTNVYVIFCINISALPGGFNCKSLFAPQD